MANNESNSSCPEDVSRWLRSIEDYLKVTQAKCLNLSLRPVLGSTEHSLKSVGADIQPFLDSLGNSAITELILATNDLIGNMQEFSQMLIKSKIELLDLADDKLNIDDVLSLMAILKDTRITELVIPELDSRFTNDQVDVFLAYLANSHLKSLNISATCSFPFEKISAFYQGLPNTQITCLELSEVFLRYEISSEDRAELLGTLTSSLQYTALTELNLGNNELDDSSAKAIGIVLENSKLEKLDLRKNLIGDTGVDFLFAGIVRSKITHLNLSGNEIEGDNAIGDSLKLTKIRKLDLSGNPLINKRMFSVSKFLQDSTVSILALGYCSNADGRVPLPIQEMRSSEVTCLDLSSNKLTLEHISALVGVLSQSNITHINLRKNEFSAECYIVLGECLRRSALEFIHLNKTAQTEDSIRGIASFIGKTKGSAIISVDLSSNMLPADIISSSLANTEFLELNLSRNLLGNNIACLAQQLKLTAIISLSLSRCDIGDDGAAALANCLEETHIVLLNLEKNSVTNRGAKALALVLKKTKLRHLDLNKNRIEDDGLACLAEHAKNSCITSIDVFNNPGERKLLVYRTTWENRTKVQQFADLLRRTAFFTGDSNIFEFDRNFDNIDCFIEDLLKFYKTVSEEPYIVRAIEHDKCILDLNKRNCCVFLESRASMYLYEEINFLIEDCELIYKKIVEHPSPVQDKLRQSNSVSFFQKQALWLVLNYFPTKFVSFIAEKMEGDVDEHVAFLKKIEELGLTGIVELLLLNRPVYMIDKQEAILHPYVYKLISKYRQTICNTEIEPEGIERIITYFTNHMDIEGASEIISLLSTRKSSSDV